MDSQSGFTMIEILMTMLILMIVLLGLAMLQLTMIRQTTHSKRTAEATQLAQLVLERYKGMRITDIQLLEVSPPQWELEQQRDTVTDMKSVNVDGEGNGPYTVQRLIETDATRGGVMVSVRVSWLDIQPGTSSDTTQYQTLNVELTTHRY